MKYYSTEGRSPAVSLREAVLTGLAPDRGLYMPERIPRLPDSFFRQRTVAVPLQTLLDVENRLAMADIDKVNRLIFADAEFLCCLRFR